MPKSLRRSSRIAANGQPGDVALTLKPSGIATTRSPWLIHTMNESGTPLKSSFPGSTESMVLPYSRFSPGSTLPPRVALMSCMP